MKGLFYEDQSDKQEEVCGRIDGPPMQGGSLSGEGEVRAQELGPVKALAGGDLHFSTKIGANPNVVESGRSFILLVSAHVHKNCCCRILGTLLPENEVVANIESDYMLPQRDLASPRHMLSISALISPTVM